MGFSLGIIGLPNVGKSTLFNLLSKAKAEVSNYPFCTIDPNVGVVEVSDERLKKIQEIMKAKKALPTVIEFYDIAGLVKNAHKGEGLGNQFLSHIRKVDAIVHVVRCFKDPNIVHVDGSVEPKRDIEIINTELILADLAVVEKKIANLKPACRQARLKAKSGDKKILVEIEKLEEFKKGLQEGKPDKNFQSDLDLLTLKPMLYVANVDEGEGFEGAVPISIKLEAEIAELTDKDKQELGLKASGLSKLIKASYELLDLITFFTANDKECRAWTVKAGTKVPQAAGKVHSDMEKGFIAADVVSYADLVKCGAYAKAREAGVLRTEGKQYVVCDGDLVLVKFNR